MKNDGVRTIGISLIIIGAVAFAMKVFDWSINWSTIWPLFPIILGLIFLIRVGKEKGIVFPAVILIGTGLIFLAQNTGFFMGHGMSELWPLFPIVVGLAFLMLYIVDGTDAGVLVPACILLGIGAIFLSINVTSWLVYIAPVAIIVIGGALIVKSFISPATPKAKKDDSIFSDFEDEDTFESNTEDIDENREIPVKYIKEEKKVINDSEQE